MCIRDSYGGVKIGDNVFIGANTIVARGTIDDTQIMDGCKIDTLCHIAHNVIIEENSVLITNSLLYGSTRLKPNAYVASGMVRNQCTVGENAMLGMGAVAVKDVPPDQTVVGNPAHELKK